MIVDPITLSVIQNGLQQVCNEMDIAFTRSAFSPIISESQDRSDGIYAAANGELISQGEYGHPIFVGTMQFCVRAVIDFVEQRKLALYEGDVFIVNDPYLGGTHLMDVKFVRPFFRGGKLWCWLANTGHWPDVGGAVPGGFSASATEVEQEGLRLPPVKLFKRGELDQEILSIIMSNIRIADQRLGDIKAQAAALSIGARRLGELLDRYGQSVHVAIQQMRERAVQQMEACIATIPDGTYLSETFVDSDGVVNEPLRIAMRVEKQGRRLRFDMTGSSGPCSGPMNSVIATTKSAIYLAVKHIFPEVPLNGGTFDPLEIVDPEGTFLFAHYPRPVSGCAAEVSQRVAEAVFAALVQAIPDRMFASPAGTSGNLSVGGYDPIGDKYYVMYVLSGGGYGGSPVGDGITNGCSTIGISKTTPVELMEQYYPVLFEKYGIHEGSGGAGADRGGFGLSYRIKMLAGTATASMVMDHGRIGPPGAEGGSPGGRNRVQIVRRDEVYVPPHLSKDQGIRLSVGDVIEVDTPGGGGFGLPSDRDPSRVERDVAYGYYRRETAAELFSVAFADDGTIDLPATDFLRRKSTRQSPEISRMKK